MKMKGLLFALAATVTIVVFQAFSFDNKEPWSEKQLMAPAQLAQLLRGNVPKPLIICVGPANYIEGGIEIGPAQEKDNLRKLREKLNRMKLDTSIVVYCGCCPFSDCPNIRPAFCLLNELKFTNHKLLDLPHNFKVDWIDKGYPIN